ncbi:ATP-binding cassette domain-containing protein [Staphylococcus aureus]
MLQVTDVSLRFGDRKLFEDVNIKFTEGNCYGLIGANGAGKSTFLKILSGELDSQTGHVSLGKNERLAVLKQDHYAYEDERVLDVVIKGHERLYEVMKEKDEIYMKPDFSDEDGIRAAELEGEFAEMNGWNAEADAANLLSGLGIDPTLHDKKMAEFANASKSKQATSRKKQLEKIELDDIQPSSRRYPFVKFTPEREIGNDLLIVHLSKTIDGEKVLDNVSFTMNPNDKAILIGDSEIAKTTLLKILAGEMEPDEGSFKWGVTTSLSYFPKDNSEFFEGVNMNLVDWLRQYAPEDEQTETFLRGFLGRMLFSGEEVKKKASVLSGGEKVRCMLSKMMLSSANVLLLDEPTNHLDLESITAVNDGLKSFKGSIIFTSYDFEFINTIANRVIDLNKQGGVSKEIPYEEYLQEIGVLK